MTLTCTAKIKKECVTWMMQLSGEKPILKARSWDYNAQGKKNTYFLDNSVNL